MAPIQTPNLAVLGLGYVGLPLATAFGKYRPVLGFDLQTERLKQLQLGHDRNGEVSSQELAEAKYLTFGSDPQQLQACQQFIITVPTPIDAAKNPDLTPLLKATELVARVLKPGDLVIYESTVYPGCTEEVCVPCLEHFSGLRYNIDYFCGYSPERINPGDQEHRLTNICKVTSGSTHEAADAVEALYRPIIQAGTHRVSSIKVAEAAKIIENCQRDLNIAFINELAQIFQLLEIDTQEVLAAAQTKWNFLPFQPGLVGGHCIGVDPYYLTYKAQSLGFHPEVILAGRRTNDAMGSYIAQQTVKLMIRHGLIVSHLKILLLGITFKENCADIRNSKVVDILHELQDFGCEVDVWDPIADPHEVKRDYGIQLLEYPETGAYGAVITAVAHRNFAEYDPRTWLISDGVHFDVKGFYPREFVHGRL